MNQPTQDDRKPLCGGAWAIPPSPVMLKHDNNYYTCSKCGEPTVEAITELPTQDDRLKDSLIEIADKHFPKGDKGRGQAMVLIAESLPAIKAWVNERLIDELESLQAADMKLYHSSVISNRLEEIRRKADLK